MRMSMGMRMRNDEDDDDDDDEAEYEDNSSGLWFLLRRAFRGLGFLLTSVKVDEQRWLRLVG